MRSRRTTPHDATEIATKSGTDAAQRYFAHVALRSCTGPSVFTIGPANVAGVGDVYNDAVWKSFTHVKNSFQIGAVGVDGHHATITQIQKE
jgi:hypothetical protein